MDRLTRRCTTCNKNYEEDNKVVLDNHLCTSCILALAERRKEAEQLMREADEIINEINQITLKEE